MADRVMDPALALFEHGLAAISGVADAKLLPLSEAIKHAGIKKVKAHVETSLLFAEMKLKRQPELTLTLDEIAAIHLYTQQCDVYPKLNEGLRDRDREVIKPFLPYLRLLLQGLRKLPSCDHNKVVFRGVKKNLTDSISKNDQFVWWALSSTSSDLQTMSNPMFCGIQGERTIFNIQVQHARNIAPFSAFASEEEIVMLPGARLKVQSLVNMGAGLVMVHLMETAEPLIMLQFDDE
jgi:hypothetical protein